MGIMAENEIVIKKINEIKPYMRNPRRNNRTVELLCELIPEVGFNVPIVIDEKGVIVKGHARFSAAIRLGMEEDPCIVTHASPEAVKVDRITDNKIAEYSEWMNEEVAEEIESINSGVDFSELGFPTVRFDGMPVHEMPQEASGSPIGGFAGNNGGIVGGGYEKAAESPRMIPKRYYKCVCRECGHVMFVEADKLRRE